MRLGDLLFLVIVVGCCLALGMTLQPDAFRRVWDRTQGELGPAEIAVLVEWTSIGFALGFYVLEVTSRFGQGIERVADGNAQTDVAEVEHHQEG